MSARKLKEKNVVEKYELILPRKKHFSAITLNGDSEDEEVVVLES